MNQNLLSSERGTFGAGPCLNRLGTDGDDRAHQFGNPVGDFQHRRRFGQNLIDAKIAQHLAKLARFVSRNDQDGQIFGPLIIFQAAADFDTVDIGHF